MHASLDRSLLLVYMVESVGLIRVYGLHLHLSALCLLPRLTDVWLIM